MVFYHHHLCPFGEGINVAAFLKDFIYLLLTCATESSYKLQKSPFKA